MTNPPTSSRPLHLQTVESLFAELISGAAVLVGENESEFRFDNSDSRSLLNWYRLNQVKWAGNVMVADVEAMVSVMTTSPPQLPIPTANAQQARRQLTIAKIVAHRFAGVHAYGTAAEPPSDFVFEPRAPITLFEGWNGAGKTSLLNTIIWCLTGEVLRPQRRPEAGQLEFSGAFTRSSGSGDDEVTLHALTPITPLPNPTIYVPPINQPVPLDSWVEITFRDQDGRELSVRRTQMRTPKGKISEVTSGIDALNIDPISLRIGTIMPAMLQFLRIGAASDLGLAAARLTGLSEVSSLAKHAAKARERLSSELQRKREQEIDEDDSRFIEARSDLQKQIEAYPAMKPLDDLPSPSSDRALEMKLSGLESHFNTLKANALTAAQSILGMDFDPNDKNAREDLEVSIGPALGQLKSMQQLPSVRRSRELSAVSGDDWRLVDELTTQIWDEATVLAELSTTPDLGKRRQLYARVASWLHDYGGHDSSSCAICSRPLSGILDPVTNRLVSDHILEMNEADQQLLSLTQKAWVDGWVGRLAAKCPTALQPELQDDLPAHPYEIIRKALVQDLFDTDAFSSSLAPLKRGLGELCDQRLPELPAFREPQIPSFPPALKNVTPPLLASLRRLARARAFAQWRDTYKTEVAATTKAILQGENDPSSPINDLTPIGRKLDALSSIVRGVAPLNSALELSQRMSTQLDARRAKERRIDLYKRAAVALESITELGELAQKQVEALRKLLHTRAIYWRDRCYHNSFPMAGHQLRSTSMDVKGVLDIRIGFEKATAPAEHISNASALRASLMGFFLAFWEHVLNTRGGLSLLVFDDPQELLDHDNKEKLARLLPELVQQGAQLFVATYDRHFARAAVSAAREHSNIEHRSVHPVNPSRSRLETAQAVEELDRKRISYERDKDNASLAQDYANEMRVFLEARLADLFDDPAYPAYGLPSRAPTFSDYLGRLRGLVSAPPNALFKAPATKEFAACNALAQGADCLKVLNTSHHDRASLSAGDVYSVANDLVAVRKLAEKMHSEFRHWRWHEPLRDQEVQTNVVPFSPSTVRPFRVPTYPDLAAFTSSSAPAQTQAEAEEFDQSWFDDKSLFLVRTDNLGFSVPEGCIAIAESAPYEGRDHNLVIARQRGHLLARRLFRSARADQLALAAEAPDPRGSKPTLFFDVGNITLHRIVGMLTEQPVPPIGGGEATLLAEAASLGQIEAAYRVREESGIPLALPGQIVLGGSIVSKDQLNSLEGTLIALGLDDGSNVFKRIGKRVPGSGGRLWQFESVGGLGTSLIVSLVEPDDDSDAPRFLCARRVIGILYTV
ncbi:AAA family ATPase [Bradyrhizobium liaoningense]|uniref:ATP-binding protein n=1 Tax=Bradyrhizobium liaoningense TaxID=43992 RepID=UPI001BA495D8|nr:ATP-binding protein [Bradyrhizobium liaoningense]MBR0739746.1 AAA family ATPase [Bradyrhizobium liaoningense]